MTSIFGGDGNDILNGTDSNDIIDGLRGADKMIGGKGFDVYYVDNIGDQVVEAVDNNQQDQILASVSLSAAQTANVERIYLIGGNIDATLGGTGFFTEVLGSAGDNKITGTKDDDEFFGFDGNDTLIGNAGRDELFGDAGDDTILGGAGRDFIAGDGDPFDNTSHPGTGDDTLDGQSAVDKLIGGAGNDTYIIDSVGDLAIETANGAIDTVKDTADNYTLADNVENLVLIGSALNAVGNALNNNMIGTNATNVLNGGAGNDTLDGGIGAGDHLIGGTGNDTFIIHSVDDLVEEHENEGFDTIKAVDVDGSIIMNENVENLIVTGKFGTDVQGNSTANVITGNDLDNVLQGNGGNDTLIGGLGSDRYILLADDAQDKIVENANGGFDIVEIHFATPTAYILGANIEQVALFDQATTATGNALDNDLAGGNDNVSYHLDGGAGNDLLFGAGGDDFLIGGTGNDELFGGEGADHMTGGVGNDFYGVDNVGDVVIEAKNGGIDTIDAAISVDLNVQGANIENLFLEGNDNINGTGNELDNWMIGSRGNNIIVGAGGNDTLDGHQGDDILAGGSGNDILEGGTGKDTMSGDAGNDIFLYRTDSLTPLATLGGDTINNFESGKDKIDIHDLFADLHIDETKNPFADGHLALVGDGQGNTLLQFDADGAGAGAAITLATIHQQPIVQADIIY